MREEAVRRGQVPLWLILDSIKRNSGPAVSPTMFWLPFSFPPPSAPFIGPGFLLSFPFPVLSTFTLHFDFFSSSSPSCTLSFSFSLSVANIPLFLRLLFTVSFFSLFSSPLIHLSLLTLFIFFFNRFLTLTHLTSLPPYIPALDL